MRNKISLLIAFVLGFNIMFVPVGYAAEEEKEQEQIPKSIIWGAILMIKNPNISSVSYHNGKLKIHYQSESFDEKTLEEAIKELTENQSDFSAIQLQDWSPVYRADQIGKKVLTGYRVEKDGKTFLIPSLDISHGFIEKEVAPGVYKNIFYISKFMNNDVEWEKFLALDKLGKLGVNLPPLVAEHLNKVRGNYTEAFYTNPEKQRQTLAERSKEVMEGAKKNDGGFGNNFYSTKVSPLITTTNTGNVVLNKMGTSRYPIKMGIIPKMSEKDLGPDGDGMHAHGSLPQEPPRDRRQDYIDEVNKRVSPIDIYTPRNTVDFLFPLIHFAEEALNNASEFHRNFVKNIEVEDINLNIQNRDNNDAPLLSTHPLYPTLLTSAQAAAIASNPLGAFVKTYRSIREHSDNVTTPTERAIYRAAGSVIFSLATLPIPLGKVKSAKDVHHLIKLVVK